MKTEIGMKTEIVGLKTRIFGGMKTEIGTYLIDSECIIDFNI